MVVYYYTKGICLAFPYFYPSQISILSAPSPHVPSHLSSQPKGQASVLFPYAPILIRVAHLPSASLPLPSDATARASCCWWTLWRGWRGGLQMRRSETLWTSWTDQGSMTSSYAKRPLRSQSLHPLFWSWTSTTTVGGASRSLAPSSSGTSSRREGREGTWVGRWCYSVWRLCQLLLIWNSSS